MAEGPAGAAIAAIGMMTPVGDCAAQTAASVRAGISRYAESPVYNKRFMPMTMALLQEEALPALKDEVAARTGLTSRQLRMLRLAEPAFKEAIAPLPSTETLPLFLSLPEPLPGELPPVGETFWGPLREQIGLPFDRGHSKMFPTGRAGGLQALEAAMEFLAGGEGDHALVGGVDTYLDLRLLATLDQQDRVLAEGVMDGFAPGEGAAFLLLEASEAGKGPPASTALVLPPGIAEEAGHRYSEETYTGDGLAEAVATALEALEGQPAGTVLIGMNGESINAKEWGVTAVRSSAALDPEHRFEHPADCFGDTGAAVAPLLIGLAAIGLRKGYLPGPVLVCCSSDGPLRGAACVTMGD